METKRIGNKITEARKRKNVSQAQLAEKVFVSAQAVGKWERGESMPDIVTLSRLAEILDVDLNYFSEKFQSTVTHEGIAPVTEQPTLEIRNSKEKDGNGWNMSQGNWVDADFSGLKNLQEKFGSSNMRNCKFNGSDLSSLILKNNNVELCDFSDSLMNKSDLQNSNLGNNAFKNCSFSETKFLKCNVEKSDFSGANFTSASFVSSNFLNNEVKDVLWNKTSFLDMGIQDIVFEGLIEDCSFENCSFYNVKFENATIVNTFFKNNRRFKKVQFVYCKVDKMTYSFLKNNMANLEGVSIL